ncbi:MAG: hypothetical protein GY696_20665 [Gammaproteobacteria bacterium]|nr:hypothetical protein [Gammaproteobacteria bacterium]
MSRENVCAATADRAARKLDLDFAMKEALDAIERLMAEDEKWKEFNIQDVSRSVNMALDAFDEAQNNLFAEVWELATRNGQDEKGAFDEEAKRIQPLQTQHGRIVQTGTFEY